MKITSKKQIFNIKYLFISLTIFLLLSLVSFGLIYIYIKDILQNEYGFEYTITTTINHNTDFWIILPIPQNFEPINEDASILIDNLNWIKGNGAYSIMRNNERYINVSSNEDFILSSKGNAKSINFGPVGLSLIYKGTQHGCFLSSNDPFIQLNLSLKWNFHEPNSNVNIILWNYNLTKGWNNLTITHLKGEFVS